VTDIAQSTHVPVVHSLCANVLQLACETSREDVALQPAAMLSLQQFSTSTACARAHARGAALEDCETWRSCHAALSATEDLERSDDFRLHEDAGSMDREPACAVTDRAFSTAKDPVRSDDGRSHVDASKNAREDLAVKRVVREHEPACTVTDRTLEVQISPHLSLLLPSCSCGEQVPPEKSAWASIAFDIPAPARFS
jgi:hypothetical protein